MRHSYFDEYSSTGGFLQRLDPGIKLFALIAFILFIIFTPAGAFVAFALDAAVLVALILLARLPAKFVLGKALTVVPFALMIGIFIPFIRKGEIAGGFSLGPLKLTVTHAGLAIFVNVLVKSLLSALAVILLTATTRFSGLLQALESLRFPRLLTMVLAFMYRYVFVIQDELMKMEQARLSRSAGGPRRLRLQALAGIAGVLFVRAYERGERVYLAMRARGFRGKIHSLDRPRPAKSDLFFLLAFLAGLAAIRLAAG